MNQSTTMHWRRLGVLCLIFVLLISSTVQASTTERVWSSVNTRINDVFHFDSYNYTDVGETVSLRIDELRSDVHVASLNIHNRDTDQTFQVNVTELNNPSPGVYIYEYTALHDLSITIEETYDANEVELVHLDASGDDRLYLRQIHFHEAYIQNNELYSRAYFVKDTVADVRVHSSRGIELNEMIINGESFTSNMPNFIRMNDHCDLILKGRITEISVAYAVYVGDDNKYLNNLIDFTDSTYSYYNYSSALDLPWTIAEGYELTGGAITQRNPLDSSDSSSTLLIEPDGTAMTRFQTDSAVNNYYITFHLDTETEKLYSVEGNATIKHSVDFSVNRQGSDKDEFVFLPKPLFEENTPIEIEWEAELGYEILSTVITYTDNNGTTRQTTYDSDVAGLSLNINDDISIFCNVVEAASQTKLSAYSPIGHGATFTGLGTIAEGETTTATFTPEPGYIITEVNKTTTNNTTGETVHKTYNYETFKSDTVTATADNVTIYYWVKVLPIEDYLLSFHTGSQHLSVTNLDQFNLLNGFYKIYKPGENATFDLSVTDGYYISIIYGLDISPIELLTAPTYQRHFSLEMNQHYNDGFVFVEPIPIDRFKASINTNLPEHVTLTITDNTTGQIVNDFGFYDDVTISWDVAYGYTADLQLINYFDARRYVLL